MTGRRKRRELHRFSHGNECDECRAKRWYLESGFRYCERGHRIEGFIEYDIDEADNFGKRGRIARKEREVKRKVTRHLRGNEARELFLECLQLILRRQLWWLVHDRRLPSELETVVRDLWDLRIRNFAELKRISDATEGTESELDWETENEVFSSQAGSDSDSDQSTATTVSRARTSWSSEPGQKWNLPGLFHCLALCYLGCLSLSLPVRLGHIYEWARDDRLLFLGALDSIPKEMLDRLPGAYHRALWLKRTSFRGGELHAAVVDLVFEYHFNYDMVFPALNTPLILFHYLRELALPAEIYVHVRAMTRLLHLDFSFNLKRNVFRLLDHPDILLIACVVFSTKLIYPFDEEERPPISYRDPSSLQIDWKRWGELMRRNVFKGLERRDIDKLQPEDVWSMSDRKIDDYLDWYEETQIKLDMETSELRELFPLAQRQRQISRQVLTEEDIDERLKTAQTCIRSVAPTRRGWVMRTGDNHATYRSVEDLPDNAKAFYGKAAEISGISLVKLVKAVHAVEKLVQNWIEQDKKTAREQVVSEEFDG